MQLDIDPQIICCTYSGLFICFLIENFPRSAARQTFLYARVYAHANPLFKVGRKLSCFNWDIPANYDETCVLSKSDNNATPYRQKLFFMQLTDILKQLLGKHLPVEAAMWQLEENRETSSSWWPICLRYLYSSGDGNECKKYLRCTKSVIVLRGIRSLWVFRKVLRILVSYVHRTKIWRSVGRSALTVRVYLSGIQRKDLVLPESVAYNLPAKFFLSGPLAWRCLIQS